MSAIVIILVDQNDKTGIVIVFKRKPEDDHEEGIESERERARGRQAGIECREREGRRGEESL